MYINKNYLASGNKLKMITHFHSNSGYICEYKGMICEFQYLRSERESNAI